ncbi:MAG: hypothetical protein U0183_23935 [Polyangiaceae bacterium]
MTQPGGFDAPDGARNPIPFTFKLPDEKLAFLLVAASRATHRPTTLEEVRDALRGALGTSRQRLVRAAGALGLRASAITLPVSEAIESSSPDAPLTALVGDDGFVVFEGREKSLARIVEPGTNPITLEAEVAAKRLGLSSSRDEAIFIAFEPTLPGDPHHDRGGHHEHPSPWERVRALLSVERPNIDIIVIYGALVGVSALAIPVTAQALVGSIALGTVLQPVIVMSVVLLAALSFSSAMRVAQVRLVEALQERLFVHTATRLGCRVVRARADAFGNEYAPEQLNRFFDVLTVQKAAAALLLDGLGLALQLVVGLGLLAFYHPLLLAFDVVLISALGFVLFGLGRGGVKSSIVESKTKYGVVAWLQELGRHPTLFKARSAEGFALDELDERLKAYVHARRTHFAVVLRQTVGVLVLHTLASASVLGLGAALVIGQKLTLGQLVAAEIVVNTVVAGVSKLGKYVETYYDLAAAVDKLGHLEDIAEEERRGAPPPGDGAFHVTFASDGTIHHAAPGERIALVRASCGSVDTFDRIHGAIRDSSIRIDGTSLGELSLGALRDEAKLVREPVVFAGSVLSNVRVGRDLSLAEVRRALRAVGLEETVDQYPGGVFTKITTHGGPLTTDETRRLTVARALAGPTRLLMFDGSLDSLSASVVNGIVEELSRRRERTTVLIATSSVTIAAMCDRVIASHDGSVGGTR